MSVAAAYRAEILAQPEAERVDYALALLDLYFDPLPAFYDACTALNLRLSAAEVRILHALERRGGRWCSLQTLTAAAAAGRDPDDWPGDHATYDKIRSLRAKLARRGLPVEVISWPEVGYRLAVAPSFSWGAAS